MAVGVGNSVVVTVVNLQPFPLAYTPYVPVYDVHDDRKFHPGLYPENPQGLSNQGSSWGGARRCRSRRRPSRWCAGRHVSLPIWTGFSS